MKKTFIILFSIVAAVCISCNKEKPLDLFDESIEAPNNDPMLTGNTISFSASINVTDKTKASFIESGLKVAWQDGDYVGVATDNDATIRVYPVTDITDDTQCTITINEVANATSYYVLFKGKLNASEDANKVAANDFSAISFNTTTKTFSGLTVGNQQVAKNSLESYLWHTAGYPLAMAGKTDGTNLTMKPCLAMFKVQIASGSVPEQYYYSQSYTSSQSIEHNHNYSAVRGFDFYQKGASTIYSSGDYTVQIADDGSLTVASANNDTKRDYRQLSQTEKLSANTPYYMCLIPGGAVTQLKFNFLGYSNNTPTITWDAVYTMTLTRNLTVAPGEFYDLGTLNPIGHKRAKDIAADEAEDAFTPIIAVDANMSDWDPSNNANLITSGDKQNYLAETGTGSHFLSLKMAYDERYIYVYIKRDFSTRPWTEGSNAVYGEGYIWYRFDTNNDGTYDIAFHVYPFAKAASAPFSFISNPTISGGSYTRVFAGTYNESVIETNIRLLRSELGIDKNDIVKLQCEGNKDLGTLTMSNSITFAN